MTCSPSPSPSPSPISDFVLPCPLSSGPQTGPGSSSSVHPGQSCAAFSLSIQCDAMLCQDTPHGFRDACEITWWPAPKSTRARASFQVSASDNWNTSSAAIVCAYRIHTPRMPVPVRQAASTSKANGLQITFHEVIASGTDSSQSALHCTLRRSNNAAGQQHKRGLPSPEYSTVLASSLRGQPPPIEFACNSGMCSGPRLHDVVSTRLMDNMDNAALAGPSSFHFCISQLVNSGRPVWAFLACCCFLGLSLADSPCTTSQCPCQV